MNRRDVVAATGALAILALAGCTGAESEDPTEETGDDGRDDSEDEVPEEEVEAFHNALTVLNDELRVESSGVESKFVWVEFLTTGDLLDDLQVVGGAYTSAVDQGLDRQLEASAIQADESAEEYAVTTEPEWGQALVDEEISGQEYLERIEETLG